MGRWAQQHRRGGGGQPPAPPVLAQMDGGPATSADGITWNVGYTGPITAANFDPASFTSSLEARTGQSVAQVNATTIAITFDDVLNVTQNIDYADSNPEVITPDSESTT